MWWLTLLAFVLSPWLSYFEHRECFNRSRSLVILKPDILHRNLQDIVMGKIASLDIVCTGHFIWTKKLAINFYEEHSNKTFFPELLRSLVGRESIYVTTEASIKQTRNFTLELRKDYALDCTSNSFHSSDSIMSFKKEIKMILSDSS